MQRLFANAWTTRVLRGVSLLIALAAIIDPAVTSMRRTRPLLSVIATDTVRDAALLADIVRRLDRRFTVLTSPLPTAVGTVLIGERLPDGVGAMAAPIVVVSPTAGRPAVHLSRVEAPTRVMLDSRANVTVTMNAHDVKSGAVEAEFVQGTLVVARTRIALNRDTVLSVPLTYVPTATGAVVLQVRAFIIGSTGSTGSPDTVRSDFVVDVRDNRWSVLFFDRRPSWMSTFVRRALERDPRFAVTSRVITSTNISRETGRPPLGLDALAVTGAFDAVVIGAPDALAQRDVEGISTLLRSRGASVLILADHAAATPADGLMDFGGWRTAARRVPAELTSPAFADGASESLRLKGVAVGFPSRLPANAVPIAVLKSKGGDTARVLDASQVAIWRVPVGLGQLVVSGAFDAWRFRDSAQSTFDATWRDLIDEAASQRQRSLELRMSRTLAQPSARMTLALVSRDSLNGAAVTASLRDANAPGATPTAMALTDTVIGGLRNVRMRAPDATGSYEIIATQGTDSARASFVVAAMIARDADGAPAVLAAWADSRSGRVVSRDQIESLPQIVSDATRPVPRLTTWHPMRSVWWIVPFAVALALEWWIRRRRGLA